MESSGNMQSWEHGIWSCSVVWFGWLVVSMKRISSNVPTTPVLWTNDYYYYNFETYSFKVGIMYKLQTDSNRPYDLSRLFSWVVVKPFPFPCSSTNQQRCICSPTKYPPGLSFSDYIHSSEDVKWCVWWLCLVSQLCLLHIDTGYAVL